MWAQVELILRQATSRIAEHVAEFLPGVLVAVLLALVTLVVAILVRVALVRVLRGVDFDRRVEQLGLAGVVIWPSTTSPAQALGRIAFWALMLLGLLASLTALNATMPAQFALLVFEYVPHLLAACMILIIGVITAHSLARSVLIGAVNMQIQSARLLSLAVKWLVLIVAVAMALDHLGIGRRITLLAFGILFGGFVLAAALAVGIGASQYVSRALKRQQEEPRRREDPVDHI
jgi:hypothetical protein